MIEFIKRFATYFGATLTFLFGAKAALGASFTWSLFCIIASIVVTVSFAVAWIETFRDLKVRDSKPAANSRREGSLALAIVRGLEHVRFADRDDEKIAFAANRIVRRSLDKRCISYEDYKDWRRKNPLIFSAIISDDGQLVGFFDVFPLTDIAAQTLIRGQSRERDLTIYSILPEGEAVDAKYVYVASIVVNPQQTAFSDMVAKELLLLKFASFITLQYPPNDRRTIFAFALTHFGNRLLQNAGFTNTRLPQHSKQHAPLYELSPNHYRTLTMLSDGILGNESGMRRRRAIRLLTNARV